MLCVHLIGPSTFNGKYGTVIDFMALTMINYATSWFKIVESPSIRWLKIIAVDGEESSIVEEIFDKMSDCIAWLVNKTWLSRYRQYCYLMHDNGSEFKLNYEHLYESYGIKR